jgi:polyhydroxyalkanoate synthesis repressor PhaR
MAKSEPPVVIKKHATRRLYDTRTAKYVTRGHLIAMLKSGKEFVVYDTKSGKDITHSVLTQIIRDQESEEAQPLLPFEFMQQLIRFYGDTLGRLLSCYLDFSIGTLDSDELRNRMAQSRASMGTILDGQVRHNVELFMRLLASFTPVSLNDGRGPIVPDDTLRRLESRTRLRRPQRAGLRDEAQALRSRRNEPGEMSNREFKIGQSLLYRKGREKESGRYVVLAVLPKTRGEVRYRIRSQDDESLEYTARESELGTA